MESINKVKIDWFHIGVLFGVHTKSMRLGLHIKRHVLTLFDLFGFKSLILTHFDAFNASKNDVDAFRCV